MEKEAAVNRASFSVGRAGCSAGILPWGVSIAMVVLPWVFCGLMGFDTHGKLWLLACRG